jgi:hypothetical protein
MKTIKWLVSIGLMFTYLATMAQAFTIDGTAESAYGSPLVVQQLGSNASANNPTNGDIATCSGSQLDAAYGVISNSTLYLVLAGNLQNDFSGSFVSKLSIFIHTGVPGQNTLANNGALGSGPDFGAIPRMSAGGDPNNCAGCPGLTFDTGFNAAYWVGISYGGTTNPSMSVNFFDLTTPNGGDSYFAGKSTPTNSVLVPSGGARNPFGIQATINDSNTGGVDTNLCTVNTNGAAQSIAAANVKTGVELAIPLGAIGGANVVGPVKITAFLSTNDYSQIFDQILSPGTPAGCVDGFAYGDPLTNNFSTLPGTHSFTVPIAGCNYSVSPAGASFGSSAGAGTFTAGVLSSGGGCSWTAVSSVPWVTITSGGSGSVGGTVSYSVASNQSTLARSGTIAVVGAGQSTTNTFTVTQSGQNLGIITVDGSYESAYGCPVAVQQISTSFGKNTNTSVLAAGGSELDAAYGLVQNNVLFLLLTGNIQDNGNRVMIFFMTGSGGTNVLVSGQPGIDNVTSLGQTRSVLSWMGPTNNLPPVGAGPGLTFDPGFAPNYFMDVNCSATAVFFSYAQLWPGGTNASGIATNGYFLGSNAGTNGVLSGGTNPLGIQATINNSNTNGVDAGHNSTGCYTNALGIPGGETAQALQVTTGIEMAIPLAALGNPTGTVAVCAFVANNTGLQLSDQILSPFGTNDPNFCLLGPGKTTNSWAPFLVMSNYPGQHFFNVGPEMRITSIAADASKNIDISYLTEASTNMTYQVQRTTVLSNNTIWANIGGLNFGTGGIVTYVDPSAATHKPARFYRIRQTPLCP